MIYQSTSFVCPGGKSKVKFFWDSDTGSFTTGIAEPEGEQDTMLIAWRNWFNSREVYMEDPSDAHRMAARYGAAFEGLHTL